MRSLQPARGKAPRGDPHEAYLALERFLKTSRQPVLMEPGEDPLPVTPDTFAVSERGAIVTLESWNASRNLIRRVRGIETERRGRLDLAVEHFGRRSGRLTLVDLDDPANRDADRAGARLKYREQFRRALHRQFPDWRIVELSTEQDLHHSLSPCYPRAFLRKGSAGLAAIGAPAGAMAGERPDGRSPNGILSFGLIWLDYLRRRETRLTIEGLAIFVPAGAEPTTCHRVRFLNSHAGRFEVFVHDGGCEAVVDSREYSNFETRLDPCHQPLARSSSRLLEWVDRIVEIEGVARRDRPDGSVSLAVRGFEFARAAGDDLLFGLDRKHVADTEAHLREIEQLARGLARMRHADATDRTNLLYTRGPESWLESEIRSKVTLLDAALRPAPVYGQVPEFAAGERSLMDLLAVDVEGRLTVIEVKAGQDIHLPLQALDYWMRVKWHLDRGDFAGKGYFPGVALSPEPPRLMLVAPSLDFHPTNETILRYLAPEVAVERLGVGLEWKRDLKVMFRIPRASWPLPYFAS